MVTVAVTRPLPQCACCRVRVYRAGAQVYRIKFLDTYEDAPTGELAAPEVLAAAVSAIVGYVKAPAADAVGKKHLVDMAAVKQLRDHAEHSRLFSLLNIFATQKLEAYVAYRAANAEYMASLGIDHESSLETIRLFSLCSLAAESTDGSISYAEIAATLQVRGVCVCVCACVNACVCSCPPPHWRVMSHHNSSF